MQTTFGSATISEFWAAVEPAEKAGKAEPVLNP